MSQNLVCTIDLNKEGGITIHVQHKDNKLLEQTIVLTGESIHMICQDLSGKTIVTQKPTSIVTKCVVPGGHSQVSQNPTTISFSSKNIFFDCKKFDIKCDEFTEKAQKTTFNSKATHIKGNTSRIKNNKVKIN